jgi:transcription factor SPN1
LIARPATTSSSSFREHLSASTPDPLPQDPLSLRRNGGRRVQPEAGNDPSDPLRPEIDQEHGRDATIAEPYQDMEATEDKAEMPDDDDIQAGLSDNESVLSEALDDDQLDEQFGDFDASNIAIEERAVIDEDTVKQIGVHKRKRPDGEGEEPKKKKKRADKPRRKKNKDGDDDSGIPDGDRRSKRSKKTGKVRGASPDVDENENLTPEERKYTRCYRFILILTSLLRPKTRPKCSDGRNREG